MIIGTSGTQLFESFKTFQSGQNNILEIWTFDATIRDIPDKVTSGIDLQMKQ